MQINKEEDEDSIVSASSDDLEYFGPEEELEEEASLSNNGSALKNLFQSMDNQDLDTVKVINRKQIRKDIIPQNLISIVEVCDLILG